MENPPRFEEPTNPQEKQEAVEITRDDFVKLYGVESDAEGATEAIKEGIRKHMTESQSENPVLSLDRIRNLLPNRVAVYKWIQDKKPTDVELTQVRDSLNEHFPGTRRIEDKAMQTVFQIVDDELFKREQASQ